MQKTDTENQGRDSSSCLKKNAKVKLKRKSEAGVLFLVESITLSRIRAVWQDSQ